MWTIFWNNNYFGDIKQKAIETKYKVRLIILKLSQGNGTVLQLDKISGSSVHLHTKTWYYFCYILSWYFFTVKHTTLFKTSI